MTKDQLVDRVKYIGQVIQNDAESLVNTFELRNLSGIDIHAEIRPLDDVQTITYGMMRLADKRLYSLDKKDGEA